MANFNVERQSVVVPDGAASRISPLFTAMFPRVNVIEANQAGAPSEGLMRNDRNNLAPRIGLAFRPFGHARSVIRAGYGIFFNVAPLLPSAGGSPFKLDEPVFINPAARPELVWPLAYPSSGVTPSAVAFPSFSSFDISFADPYTQQWNLSLEQQVGKTGIRLSYIGTVSRLMEYSRDVNSPEPNSIPYIQKPRPLPNYAAISQTTNGASHAYHALQIEGERQLASGMFYQAAYTFAKDVGDHHRGLENPFNRRMERSAASRIPLHRVVSNFLWELPVGRGKYFAPGAKGVLQGVVGGWQLSGIINLQSGDYLTPTYNAPDIHTNIAHTTSLTPPTVSRRPDRIGDGNLPSGQSGPTRWFDTTAFKDPGCPAAAPFCSGAARTSVGRFGDAGASIIRGPGSALVHLGLGKAFMIRERARLRFEFTGTNVINRKNWNNPNTDLSNPVAVARITGIGGAAGTFDFPGPREMRLEVRLDF